MKKIFISGVTGKVGKLLSSFVINDKTLRLVGGSCSITNKHFNKDIGELLGTKKLGITISEKIPDDLNVDVIVDFSSPKNAMDILQSANEREIPILIGTTGFLEDQLSKIITLSKNIPILFAPNTSQGIAVLKSLINSFDQFFSADNHFHIEEIHHSEKKDSPSGTALELKNEILSIFPGAKVSIDSLREGINPGEHKLSISLDDETIELTHRAENRSIFAKGALNGAVWLLGKGPGLYSMKDIYSS